MGGTKDRWHELDDAIDDSGLPPSDRAVFRVVLKKTDYVTAEPRLSFTPTRQEIRRKTGLSLRQIAYSVGHLVTHGWLSVKKEGRRDLYTLSVGGACDCRGRVHVAAKRVAVDWPEVALIGATDGSEKVQPLGSIGATTAPIKVQPIGATPQVDDQVVLRGSERKGEEAARPFVPVWDLPRPPRDESWQSWPPGSIGEAMNR